MSDFNALAAVSPLDGRYSKKPGMQELANVMGEYGLFERRLLLMILWFVELSKLGLPRFPKFSDEGYVALEQIIPWFTVEDAAAIKEFEKTTNHDVKAVEYWLKDHLSRNPHFVSVLPHIHFIHFGLTSEDVNNIAHALQLQDGREILLTCLDKLVAALRTKAHLHADVPMLARTHGQAATPTTVGKEFANFVARLARLVRQLRSVELYGKINGATGSYNALLAAYPDTDWELVAEKVVRERLGLQFQIFTTQIEPHDYMVELFNTMAHLNTVLIGLCRDIWGYISLGYFKQKAKDGEVGSSTMPHKVNPIDFENAEGNLGVANALLRHMAATLPISRFQRDLTDSTLLRNMGVALSHSLLAYTSILSGLGKLRFCEEGLLADLNAAPEVLAEPIQTVMRSFGNNGAYEALKAVTRGKSVTVDDLHELIKGLDIPDEDKARLLALTPATYIGKAAELARQC